MDYVIRKKERKDCRDIAHIITVAWNETYKGIVSSSFLDNLYKNEDERANNSFIKFNDSNNHYYVLEVNNKIVGFINVGASYDKDYSDCGEICALYIINGFKGYGFGKKLVEVGIKELKSMGYNKMIIGCLVGNKSNEFYKHIGGKYVKTRVIEMLQLPENVYYFDTI